MRLSVYQKKAYEYAVYPKDSMYPVMALSEEQGELSGKIAKAVRKGQIKTLQDIEAGSDLHKAIAKELGDVLWNVAAIATELGMNLDVIAQLNLHKLDGRKSRDVISGSGDER